MTSDPLANLVFIKIPDALSKSIGDFKIDTKILLPIDKVEGETDLTDLTWEMIVSGILKVLAYDRKNSHFDYYQEFVLAVKPSIYEELTNTGIIKAEQKDWRLAEEIFLAAEGLDLELPRSQLNLAILYENWAADLAESDQGDRATEYKQLCKKKYSQAMSGNPPLPDAFFNAGFFYLKEGAFEKAKPLLETFLEISRDEAKSTAAKQALENFEKQGRMDLLFKEAYDFIILGKEQDSIDKIKVFLQSYPQVWNAWFLLGWAYRRLGQFQPALEAFTEATAKGADKHVDTLNELAICQMELGQLKDSRATLVRALTIDPENVKIMSNLGVLALKTANLAEARGFFETVLEYQPDDPLAMKYLASMA